MGEVNSAGSSRLLSKIVHSKSNKDDFGIYSLKCIAWGCRDQLAKGLYCKHGDLNSIPRKPHPPNKTKQNKKTGMV